MVYLKSNTNEYVISVLKWNKTEPPQVGPQLTVSSTLSPPLSLFVDATVQPHTHHGHDLLFEFHLAVASVLQLRNNLLFINYHNSVLCFRFGGP